MNGAERRPAKRTLADVAVCRSIIKSMSTEGTPIPCMAFQSAFLSMESNAAFKSTNATCSGCWNSLWISVNRCNARIASSVDRQRVNPDW